MTNLIAKVAELRELAAKATNINDAVLFHDEQETGELIQVSPGCYEGGPDGMEKTGEVLYVKNPKDPNEYPESLATFDRPKDADHYIALRNAAPRLLAALGKVHAGDAKILAEILSFIESEATESDWEDAIDLLRRHADLARLMEDTP